MLYLLNKLSNEYGNVDEITRLLDTRTERFACMALAVVLVVVLPLALLVIINISLDLTLPDYLRSRIRSDLERDARLLVAGQTLSAFGDFAMWIVMAVWMKTLTGSSARAGLVFFVLAFVLTGHTERSIKVSPAAGGSEVRGCCSSTGRRRYFHGT